MAATYTDAERNFIADQEAGRISHLSAHTGNPGTTGANEATGGSPAYARKAVTFNPAGSNGPLGGTLQPGTVGIAWSSEVTFDLAANTYTHAGGWSAATGGTFRGGNAMAGSQVLAAQGQLKVSIGVGQVSGA
jgi:hypothetical protein